MFPPCSSLSFWYCSLEALDLLGGEACDCSLVLRPRDARTDGTGWIEGSSNGGCALVDLGCHDGQCKTSTVAASKKCVCGEASKAATSLLEAREEAEALNREKQ